MLRNYLTVLLPTALAVTFALPVAAISQSVTRRVQLGIFEPRTPSPCYQELIATGVGSTSGVQNCSHYGVGGQVGATALIGNGQVHTWKAKADLATRDAQNGSALMANQSVVAFANSIITDAVTPKSSNVQATTVAFHFAIDGSFVLNYGTPCSIPGDPRCDWANTSASMFVTFNARTQGSSPSAAQNFRSLLGGHQVSNGGQYVGTDSWVPVSDPNNGFFGYVGSTRGIFSAILPVNASGIVSFRGDIQANASYTNHNPYPANIFSSLSVDFSNTALLAGVTAYDADGNDITADTEFEFESGTVVPKGMPTVVPEPSTYAMLSLGLLALGFARKRIT